jgi:proteasome inhibitor subunit 1 (PI31)
MSQNILDPSALTSRLPKLLPKSNQTLQNPQDALSALIHTAFTVLGFRLIGVDDTSSASTFDGNVLPEHWNTHGPGHYTFRYKHEQSSLEFLLKMAKLGNRFTINAIGVEVCIRHSTCKGT